MINLESKSPAETRILDYLNKNASEEMIDKINNGTPFTKDGKSFINKKTLSGFMDYANKQARELAEQGKNYAMVNDDVVFGWAIHYFEEEAIEEKLYCLDGNPYVPPKKDTSKTNNNSSNNFHPLPMKPPETKPQMSFFDMFSDTPKVEDGNIDEQPSQEEIDEAFEELEEEQNTKVEEVKPIINSYIDRAMTGTNENRPAFQKMIKDSSKKEWDYILVYKLDRFSRDKYATAIYKKTLKDNGVKVLSAMENIPDTREGIILESLLEGMNQYYSAELSQKVKRGMKENLLKGNYTGGTLVYGYNVKEKKVTINEEEAKIVKYIFEQYAMNVYVKDIIAGLNNKGITKNGKAFARNTVYHILKNEKYAGIYRYNNQIYENIYPQIITKELYEKANKSANKMQKGKDSVKTKYLLKGKLMCGHCGSNITAETGTSRLGIVNHYYKCSGRKLHNGCKKTMLRKEYLEKIVIDYTVISLGSQLEKIIDVLLNRQKDLLKENSNIAILSRKIGQTESSINNILQVFEQGGSTPSTIQRLKELEQKKEELEKEFIFEKSKVPIILTRDDIKEYYVKALKTKPKLLISLFVKQVIVFDEKIIIKLNSPIETSPDDNQGFIFYDKCETIRKYVQHSEREEYIKLKIILEI